MDDQKTESPQTNGTGSRSFADLSTPIYGLFILGILYTLYIAHQIVLPIILAVLTSLLLAPLVKKAYLRWHLPRVVSALVLVLAVLGLRGLAVRATAVSLPALALRLVL